MNTNAVRIPKSNKTVTLFACCLALAVFSLLNRPPSGFSLAVVLTFTGVLTFALRPIYDKHLKALCYLFLGMIGYDTFGGAFLALQPAPGFPISVVLSLAALGALVSLVTYVEGRSFGTVFAGGALVMFFFAQSDIMSMLASFLIFLSAYIVVHFISKITGPDNYIGNVLAASFGLGAFIFLAGLASIANGGIYSISIPLGMGAAIEAGVMAIFASIGFTFLTLSVFDSMLSRMRFKRIVDQDEGVMFGSLEEQPAVEPLPIVPMKQNRGLNLKRKKR